MNKDDLINRYPYLYHMAAGGSWPSLKNHGLLCTTALLDLYEIGGADRERLLRARRAECEFVVHPRHGRAMIRDQKPIVESKLRACLTGGLTTTEWYEILNQRVFFWLTEERLNRLLTARAYRAGEHDVIIVRSQQLIKDYEEQIELTSMNTGNTNPIAHPRGRDTFKKIADYPLEHRVARGLEPIVELTVRHGIPNIRDYVVRIIHWENGRPVREIAP